jgi:Zn-dependent protease/CBS domain-containing protein
VRIALPSATKEHARMNWSFPIGTVKGTVIRIHLTFVLFLVWIGVSAYAQGGQRAAVEGVVFLCLLFACVLLHEFGHVFAARRYGVQTPDITLLPIGGVARLERIPEKPSEELVVALAGPAVNVVIAALLFLVLGGLPDMQRGMQVENAGVGLLERLAWVNVTLVVFNLIPAFPMDGGRVLRALLASRMGYARGTRIAAGVGQAVAFALGLAGLFGNPVLIFIALFVYMGAAAEASAAQMRDAGRGMIAADAAETRIEALAPTATVEDAVERLLRTSQHDFPVVDGAGRLRGVLARDDIIRALRERGPEAPVLEVMRRDVPVLHHRQPLDEALRALQAGRHPAVGVVDSDGRLVGLITPENVGELMMVQAARPPRRPPMANPWDAAPTA